MKYKIIKDLRTFLDVLRQESELLEVTVPVDPCLEIAEIHRRVIARGGPALLFTNVKGSRFPVATNLFGSAKRLELAFGRRPQQFVADIVRAAESLLPPTLNKLWSFKHLAPQALKIGSKQTKTAPILDECQKPPRLTELPMLTSWDTDGGAFVTLPLVYTEHP
ncbi:MAG: UbiD family decarboxylase, partial [Desulfobulbaceae bacterium]|nr:UbiD family decarboxylase [Desulfobulbaceae bacterium]